MPSPTTATSSTPTSISGSNCKPQLSKAEAQAGKIWNRFADGYYKKPIQDQESYQKKLEMTREYLKPQSSVLEFGCGTGGTALLHAPFVRDILGIDLSSRMIEIAQHRTKDSNVKNVQFECAGMDSLDKANESYDVVMGMSVLHLMPDKDNAMKKVHSLLKPGGYFISSTACIGDFAKFIGWVAAPFSYVGLLPKLNVFTKSDLRSRMENAGFKIEKEYHPAKDKAVFLVAKKI